MKLVTHSKIKIEYTRFINYQEKNNNINKTFSKWRDIKGSIDYITYSKSKWNNKLKQAN